MSRRTAASATHPAVSQLPLFMPPSGETSSPTRSTTPMPASSVDPRASEMPTPAVAAEVRAQPSQRVRRSALTSGEALAAALTADPLVIALAQLVRDRWAAEQADDRTPVALRALPSIMAITDLPPSSVEESTA